MCGCKYLSSAGHSLRHCTTWIDYKLKRQTNKWPPRFPTNHDCLLQFLFPTSHRETDNDFICGYRGAPFRITVRDVDTSPLCSHNGGAMSEISKGTRRSAARPTRNYTPWVVGCVCNLQLQTHRASAKLSDDFEGIGNDGGARDVF